MIASNNTHFKIRLWVVIGPADAGKSSVIGALVSQPVGGPGGARRVLLRGGGWLYVHAFRRSVQEAGQTPVLSATKIESAARKLQSSTALAYYNVLIALRSDVFKGFPIAEAYLAEYIKRGWDLQSIVLLDAPSEYNRYVSIGVPLYNLENSSELCSVSSHRNWVFGQVRNHLGWA